MINKLRPPEGYATWLDYAVETFDTRALEVEALFADESHRADREAIRNAARQELAELRLRAQKTADSRDGTER